MWLLLAPSVAASDQRVCGNGEVVLKAAVGEVMEVVFEHGVGDLVRSGDPSTLKVEHTSGHLFLTPLSPSPAQVTVIDKQGSSHMLRWIFGQAVDRKIDVVDCISDDRQGSGQDIVMRIMRDLIAGRVPAGTVQKEIDEVLFDDARVRMRAVIVHEAPKLLGYVMVVANMTAGTVAIPVQQMSFPGLLAVSSSRDVLDKGEEAVIYMVVRR